MTFTAVATALFVLALLVVQLAAVGYYLRHWGLRQARTATLLAHEGLYFKRYVPPALRPRYDQQRTEETRRRTMRARTLKAAMVTTLGGGIVAIIALAAGAAWPHLRWVDLTAPEIAALDYTAHGWVREPERTLPEMDEFVHLLRARGVVLAGLPDSQSAPGGLAAIAAAQWQSFFSRHRIPVRQCRTFSLERCGASEITVVLPGHWDRASIERLLAARASLLLYGPPLQTMRESQTFELHGLRFAPQQFSALPQLALAGDETLTLGFDAGLVLPIEPSFRGYVAASADPQAVAIDVSRYIGGDLQTRLYAQRVGGGRFVWMDFSPNAADHYEMLEERYLNALVAAVFRYLTKREYTAWATWPGGRRFAGMLSVDAEDMFARVGAIAKLAREQQVPITWFVLSNEAQRHRRLLRQLAAVGEVACHGDSHASFPLGSARSQVVRIARCRKALAEVAQVNVIAFRPPYEDYNDATVDAVANNGMSYYFAEAGGDRAVPVMVRSRATGKTLVSLPRIGSDDFELWGARRLDVRGSIEQADHEFRWARTLGGLLIFDFHTQFVNTERLQVIGHYAQRFKREDVHLATADRTARWWRLRDRLIRGEAIPAADACEYRPILLRVDRNGELVRLTTPSAIRAALPEHAMARRDGWRAAGRLCGRR